ncbi:MAG: putative toxin-antitoxin system toxin component, PIN family [Kiritimatiellaeota bacterium]|nr:putative toxin-antitoxin system toxin component, PIN family [Kiritimatiellota bacterium]
MKVVIDTNVLVSGLLSPSGMPASIINLVLNQKIKVLYDNRIIQEYQNVLERPKFKFDKQVVADLMEFIKQFGEFTLPTPVRIKFTDTGDIPFYEVASSGGADFLITGNLKHFPKGNGFKVVSPSEFNSTDKLGAC